MRGWSTSSSTARWSAGRRRHGRRCSRRHGRRRGRRGRRHDHGGGRRLGWGHGVLPHRGGTRRAHAREQVVADRVRHPDDAERRQQGEATTDHHRSPAGGPPRRRGSGGLLGEHARRREHGRQVGRRPSRVRVRASGHSRSHSRKSGPRRASDDGRSTTVVVRRSGRGRWCDPLPQPEVVAAGVRHATSRRDRSRAPDCGAWNT